MSGDTTNIRGTEALPRPRAEDEAAFTLTVVDGPSQDTRSSPTLHVQGDGARFLIGTSQSCALRLQDRSVSRRHFAAFVEQGALRVEDLGSTNGLFIENVRVFSAEVGDRARIRAGATVIAVERVNAAPIPMSKNGSFGRLLGGSDAMRRLYPILEQLASAPSSADTTILIEGEAGTGKELLAEVIHEQSARRDSPFTVCDGTAHDIDLRLFGTAYLPGLVDQGGTILIREVTHLPPSTQVRLACVIERRFPTTRSDGSPLVQSKSRILVSTRRDVDLETQHGRMDEGLATILGRVRVELPPLRSRAGDIPLLANYFFKKVSLAAAAGDAVIPPVVMQRFESYRWHGNVRELASMVSQLAMTGSDLDLDPELEFRRDPHARIGDIAERLLVADLPLVQARTVLGEEFDRRYLAKILAAHGGNVSRAAAASGVARRYFQTLRTKHGLAPNSNK